MKTKEIDSWWEANVTPMIPPILTDTERRVLEAIRDCGRPASAANIGDKVWRRGPGDRRYGNCSCPFARPAGRVLKRLREMGLTELVSAEDRSDLHGLTKRGRAAVAP